MRSAGSNAVSSRESIVLHMLDWFVECRMAQIRAAIEAADPDDCPSVNIEAVGFTILKQWPEYEQDFFAFVKADPFAQRFLDEGIVRIDLKSKTEESRRTTYGDELAGRVGSLAKHWTQKHRKRIEKNRERMRILRQVQET